MPRKREGIKEGRKEIKNESYKQTHKKVEGMNAITKVRRSLKTGRKRKKQETGSERNKTVVICPQRVTLPVSSLFLYPSILNTYVT